MKFADLLRVAWRNLRRQKLRTSLTVFAIVIGTVAVTVMLSLVTSASGYLTDQFTRTGEIKRVIATTQTGLSYREAQWGGDQSSEVEDTLTDADVASIDQIPNVSSSTPTVLQSTFTQADVGAGMVDLRNTATMGYVPNGTIRHEVLAGNDLTPASAMTGTVLTRTLANDLGAGNDFASLVGKTVRFERRADFGPESGGTVALTIDGVVASDERMAFVTLDEMRALTTFTREYEKGPGESVVETFDEIAERGYSSIYIDAATEADVDQVVNDVRSIGLGAAAGKSEVTEQQTAFAIIGAVLGGLGGIALFVAAIGVINTMVMATLERTREIGVMRAVGATKATVRRVFTVEAGMIGFLGGVVGIVLSFGVSVVMNAIINEQLASSGVTATDVVSVPVGLVLVVLAGTTLIGVLAGGLPARRAARLDPIEALRYE